MTRRKTLASRAMRLAVGGASMAAALLAPVSAWACRCRNPRPDFYEVAARADVVVIAEITRHIRVRPGHSATGFEIRVLESIKGTESRSTIELVDPSPSMCSVNVAEMEIGSRWAVVLNPGHEHEGAFGRCAPGLTRVGSDRSGRERFIEGFKARMTQARGHASPRPQR